MHIELIFPGTGLWVLEVSPQASDGLPRLVMTETRELIGALPDDIEVAEAPGFGSKGKPLAEIAVELRRSSKPLFVVTTNAVRLGEHLVKEGVSQDRFRVHCVGAGSKPFSARISSEGHLLAFAVDGGTRSVYNTFSYAS